MFENLIGNEKIKQDLKKQGYKFIFISWLEKSLKV